MESANDSIAMVGQNLLSLSWMPQSNKSSSGDQIGGKLVPPDSILISGEFFFFLQRKLVKTVNEIELVLRLSELIK